MQEFINAFHFLRPWWLLLLVIPLFFYGRYLRGASNQSSCLLYTSGAVAGSAVCQSGDVVKYKECKKEPTVCPAESWNLESYWCNGALKCWIK